MKYLWTGAIAGTVVIFAAVIAYRYQPVELPVPAAMMTSPKAPSSSATESQRMQQEIAELRQLVKSVRPDAAATQRLAATPAAEKKQESAITEAEERAAAEQQHAAYMDSVASAFNSEAVDMRWASGAAASVRAALDGDEVLRNLAGEIDCRQQTCRVEIQDDGSDKFMKSLPMLANNLAGTLPAISAQRIDNGSGRAIMVLYMSRSLPSTEMVQRH